jgi:hypothetical protein
MVCISEAGKELASGGMGALLVSLFNVKWGCRARAGGVEVLEFCLFLVFFPARCTSSISPRFYFRKHVFCFLPLVAILESPQPLFSLYVSPFSTLALLSGTQMGRVKLLYSMVTLSYGLFRAG